MDIRTERYGPLVVFRLAGRLDAHGAKALEEAVNAVPPQGAGGPGDPSQGPRGMVMDMPGVDYLSSAGVRVLLGALKAQKARLGSLALAGVGDYCRKVLEMSGLLPSFPIFADAPDAMDHCLGLVREAKVLERWDELETADTAVGRFRFIPGSAEAGRVKVLGRVQHVLEASITRQGLFEKRFSDTEYSIGLGSLGGSLEDSFTLMGEMMTIGGTMVWLPTDGNDTPDFLIPRVDTGSVRIKTAFNVALDGAFNECAMFEAEAPDGASMGEIYRAVFELARERRPDFRGVVGLAAWANMAEVLGSGILRAPVADFAPADGESIISPRHVDEWFVADIEPRHRDVTALVCGLGADLTMDLDAYDREELESVFYLHPANTAGKTALLHNHAVLFAPQPLPGRVANLDRAVREVAEAGEFLDMRHLLDSSRIRRALLGLVYVQRFVPDDSGRPVRA